MFNYYFLAREQAEASARALNKDFQPPTLYSQSVELPPEKPAPVVETPPPPVQENQNEEDIDGMEYEGSKIKLSSKIDVYLADNAESTESTNANQNQK